MSSLRIIRQSRLSLILIGLSTATASAAGPLDPPREAAPAEAPPPGADTTRPSSPFHEAQVGAFASPLGLLVGIVAVDVGVAVAPNVALTLGGSAFDYGLVSGFGVDLGTQLFVTGKAFGGFYLQPRVGFDQAQVSMVDPMTGNGIEDSVTLMHGDALAGYQWLFRSGLSIRLGAGIRYSASLGDVQGMDVTEYQRARGMLDGAVGYVF